MALPSRRPIANGTHLIYVRGRRREKKRARGEEAAESRARVSRERAQPQGGARLLSACAEYHFFRSRKFSLFSAAIVVVVVFSRGQIRNDGWRRIPSLPLRFRSDVTACRRKARRAAPRRAERRFSRPAVCQTLRESARFRGPSSPFLPSCPYCRQSSSRRRLKGLCDGASLPRDPL